MSWDVLMGEVTRGLSEYGRKMHVRARLDRLIEVVIRSILRNSSISNSSDLFRCIG